MVLNRSLIAVVALVLLATTLLISSLDYSSAVITTGSGPSGGYGFVGKDEGPTEHDLGNLPRPGNETNETLLPQANASDPFLGLFGRKPGDGGLIAVGDSGSTLLIISTAAVVIAAVTVAAFIIVCRRRIGNLAKKAIRQPAATTADSTIIDLHEGLFRLRFPQIREPFPLTWGADEPLEMTVTSEDGATLDVLLSIDGKNRLVCLENGYASIPLKLKKGSHKVTVDLAGDVKPGSESWANVRIVDYREEVVRMFNELCLRFLPEPGEPGYEMTPRELGLAIGSQLPESKQKLLDMAVTAFERANYSLHDVRRADYEAMYTTEVGVV